MYGFSDHVKPMPRTRFSARFAAIAVTRTSLGRRATGRPSIEHMFVKLATIACGTLIVYTVMQYNTCMATITLRVPDDDLALIDAEAAGNRTQFMLAAARAAALQRRRERLDEEVSRILTEDAETNLELLAELAPSMADGIE